MKKNKSETLYSFDGLENYSKEKERFSRLFEQKKLSPAILFSGRENIRKEEFVVTMSALIYCKTRNACGVCSSCLSIKKNKHPNILIIDEKKSPIKVQVAQTVQEHLNLLPDTKNLRDDLAYVRVVVICNVDLLTTQAANKLLKTIEEPLAPCFIFMTTSYKSLVLKTILSRSISWHLPIKSENKNEDQGAISSLKKLLLSKNEIEVLNISENLTKNLKLSPLELIYQLEVALNMVYKDEGDEYIEQRRILINQFKLLAREKSPFNQRLFLENVGLCKFINTL